MAVRLSPKHRKGQLLRAAYRLADELKGAYNSGFNREAVADRCGVSPQLISYYFGGIRDLRTAVLEMAYDNENKAIIEDAERMDDPITWRQTKC